MMKELDMILQFKTASKRLLLLDYDGTLVDYVSMPDKSAPSKGVLQALKKIIADPANKLVVVTGRSYMDIDRFLGHLPVDIVAEHGAMRKENGQWKTMINDNNRSWKNSVLPLLNRITGTCVNSFIEEKHFSLTWHYRNAPAEIGYTHSRELIRLLENIIGSYQLKVIDGNKIVEIVDQHISKGKAVKLLAEADQYDCILCIGDDKTDEDMFEYLLTCNNAITIKVGDGETLAGNTVGSVQDVIKLLEKIGV